MADYGIRKYRLGSALFARGLLEGFRAEGTTLRTVESVNGTHNIFLPALDSAQSDCRWGRITMQWDLGPECVLTIRALAMDQDSVIRNNQVVRVDDLLTDPDVPRAEKEKLFTLGGGTQRSGVRDLLLTEQNGRWLWLWLEITGEGGENSLKDLEVYVPGDHFFRTFPEVYKSDNDFFERYISIFSTLYQEFQEEIDRINELVDVDIAPESLLPVYASWLGLEVDEALFSGEELRALVKKAPKLMAWKGSRRAIEEAVGLFVKGKIYVVERNLLRQGQSDSDLYGKTPCDFTVMVEGKMDEKLRLRLQFLIDQFKPVRSTGRVVFLEDCGGLDTFTFLDINGTVFSNGAGSLDDGKALTGMTYLD